MVWIHEFLWSAKFSYACLGEELKYFKLYIYIYINFSSNILEIQDDEVEETVYRDRKRQLPLEVTVELTEETFHATAMASDSVVLFYAGCEYYEALELTTVLHIGHLGRAYLCILLLHIVKWHSFHMSHTVKQLTSELFLGL